MDVLKTNQPAPKPVGQQQPKVVLGQNLKKIQVVIDADGNEVSSQNPREAVVIKKPNFND